MTLAPLLSSNEYKKKLSRCYNEVHKELYGVGVTQLRIEPVSGTMIMFLVKHQRVPALRALEDHYPELKQSVDAALHQEFKRRIRARLAEELELEVTGVLRDYDPETGWACTVVMSEAGPEQ
ncbi:Na-translocating system protein MpsC family protein [Paenibacillus tengchongensis]|uniref:Na-translocating system protein MpsC family protein n=1 Tax=Paenibacillus tengchongensis TaxID=2608684 RepID=UPI00124CB68B|nr:Na-translocating system protein MpsC family protein [Paenibacillus tengchongensis]